MLSGGVGAVFRSWAEAEIINLPALRTSPLSIPLLIFSRPTRGATADPPVRVPRVAAGTSAINPIPSRLERAESTRTRGGARLTQQQQKTPHVLHFVFTFVFLFDADA